MKKGFTLLELMIVISIIGILAAFAIGIYARKQEEAKATIDTTNPPAITEKYDPNKLEKLE